MLNTNEKYWIQKLDSICPKGYNLTNGGEGGDTFTNSNNKEQQRKNKSKHFKKLWLKEDYRINFIKKRTGQKRSKETRLKQSIAAKGKPKSEMHKKHLSKAWKKRKKEKPFTKETREKMSKSLKGKNLGKYLKIYAFLDPDGNERITNEGFCKFSKENKIDVRGLRELVQFKRKEFKGWKYIRTISEYKKKGENEIHS